MLILKIETYSICFKQQTLKIMKKFTILLFFTICILSANAQVFSTAKTLKPGTVALGVQPTIIANGVSDFILFGHVGYGIAKGIDIAAKAGVLHNSNYIGADIEFSFMKNMSLSAGAHVWGVFGLDATYLITFDIAKNVDLYAGADADLMLEGNTYLDFWIPFGVEVQLSKNLAFLMEAEVALTDGTAHMFGGGVVAYF